MNIGQQIRQQREQRHWSQTDLSKKLAISRESVSKWEKLRVEQAG
ncbi:helix-turn-helix domain-containing protein [Furfurilactobacillus curtus]|uniref:HTH cro/C1-type domain-containing protein n=1 Tax=Furfurilactobacillus curtus TaxID=1746200 RepID=A0ABQ5JTD2_9LACO